MYGRNQHNIVNQSPPIKNKSEKGEQNITKQKRNTGENIWGLAATQATGT